VLSANAALHSFLTKVALSPAAVCCLQDHMANRQDGPHAHCNVFHPSYRWVFVPDLGDNCIYQYGYKDGRLTPQVHVPLGPGDGPRHFVFHPKLPVAFSGCELGSRLQVRRDSDVVESQAAAGN
jgi:6-phosphogluconolactonase